MAVRTEGTAGQHLQSVCKFGRLRQSLRPGQIRNYIDGVAMGRIFSSTACAGSIFMTYISDAKFYISMI
jgi:hypothetical protein